MVSRVHRELTDADIAAVARTYHAWRGEEGGGQYEDVPGFCRAASTDEVRSQGHVLTAGRYVGVADPDEDGEPVGAKLDRLQKILLESMDESDRLGSEIRRNLQRLTDASG